MNKLCSSTTLGPLPRSTTRSRTPLAVTSRVVPASWNVDCSGRSAMGDEPEPTSICARCALPFGATRQPFGGSAAPATAASKAYGAGTNATLFEFRGRLASAPARRARRSDDEAVFPCGSMYAWTVYWLHGRPLGDVKQCPP